MKKTFIKFLCCFIPSKSLRKKFREKYKDKKSEFAPFPESKLAHKYLDGLKGIEIGGGATNPFGLNVLNIDYTDKINEYKRTEINLVGYSTPVDIVANGDDLPFRDNIVEFVLNAHVLEHFWTLLKP